MERDTDLLKLQILADYYHSVYVTYASFIFGFVIAWAVALITLFWQNAFNLLTYWIALFSGYAALIAFLLYVQKVYHDNLDRIDELIQSINKDRFEPLPLIRELKRRQPRPEPKQNQTA